MNILRHGQFAVLATTTIALLARAAVNDHSVADLSGVPGVVIDHVPAKTGIYVGSPSIAKLPNGDYVATHDEFGPKSTEHRARSPAFSAL